MTALKKLLLFAILMGASAVLVSADQVKNSFFSGYSKVLHYRIDTEGMSLKNLDDTHPLLSQYLFEDFISIDHISEDSLVKAGYVMNEIPSSKFTELDSIFRFRPRNPDAIIDLCTPVYRDYLLFKKGKAIVGLAQICFQCGKYAFLGARASTENFGDHGEFGKLRKLLDSVSGK